MTLSQTWVTGLDCQSTHPRDGLAWDFYGLMSLLSPNSFSRLFRHKEDTQMMRNDTQMKRRGYQYQLWRKYVSMIARRTLYIAVNSKSQTCSQSSLKIIETLKLKKELKEPIENIYHCYIRSEGQSKYPVKSDVLVCQYILRHKKGVYEWRGQTKFKNNQASEGKILCGNRRKWQATVMLR